jgi:hypothetical protein
MIWTAEFASQKWIYGMPSYSMTSYFRCAARLGAERPAGCCRGVRVAYVAQ